MRGDLARATPKFERQNFRGYIYSDRIRSARVYFVILLSCLDYSQQLLVS